jgi:heterodisulfide reductase subunit C
LTLASDVTQEVRPQESELPEFTFLDEVIRETVGESRLEMCIQCGTCGGSCPSGPDMDHTPRHLFAMIRAGLKDEVLASNTPWYCVSCYFCTVRCPQEVHITDIMYTLKRMAIEAKLYEEKRAPDLSQTFVSHVENYGRSFEFGLATRQYLRYQPFRLVGEASMGLELLSKGRLDLTPHRIEGRKQLRAILKKAKKLEKEVVA